MTTACEYTHAECEIVIEYDEDSENPRTAWDNQFTMVCFHSRYTLGDPEGLSDVQDMLYASPKLKEWWVDCHNPDSLDLTDPQDLSTALERCGFITLPLYLYDHSGLTMNTAGFGCPWDSGQVGVIVADLVSVKKEHGWKRMSPQRREQLLGWMRGEVKEYDRHLTGDVYGYTVTTPDGEDESCWGLFGIDYAKEAAEEAAQGLIKWEREKQAKALIRFRERKTNTLKALIRNRVSLGARWRVMGASV